MFPIIPQHLTRQSLNSFVLNTFRLSESNRVSYKIENLIQNCDSYVKCGVFASESIAKNSATAEVSATELARSNEVIASGKLNILKCPSTDLLVQHSDPTHNHTWIRRIQFGKDVHSYNVILEITSRRKLRLRVIKDIQMGDELLIWFTQDILAMMHIPFLAPVNILDQNRYTCNMCSKIFEYPNLLKIHLATRCDREDLDVLWSRLNFNLLPQQEGGSCGNSSRLEGSIKMEIETANSSNAPEFNSFHTYKVINQRMSAFQPVASLPKAPFNMPPRASPPTHIPNNNAHHQQNVALAAAAHLETIVSNMGTSKQGHLCIYCGKLYSRKYGLKIHIRTHTGFKPLNCKYCLRPFGDPSNLNKHVRLHTQNRNSIHKCSQCDKILIRRRDLLRHMQTRHYNNPDESLADSPTPSSTSSDTSDGRDLDLVEDDEINDGIN